MILIDDANFSVPLLHAISLSNHKSYPKRLSNPFQLSSLSTSTTLRPLLSQPSLLLLALPLFLIQSFTPRLLFNLHLHHILIRTRIPIRSISLLIPLRILPPLPSPIPPLISCSTLPNTLTFPPLLQNQIPSQNLPLNPRRYPAEVMQREIRRRVRRSSGWSVFGYGRVGLEGWVLGCPCEVRG